MNGRISMSPSASLHSAHRRAWLGTLLAALLLAVALTLSGCGGGGGGGGGDESGDDSDSESPSVQLDVAGESVLAADSDIVLRFTVSMDPDTLKVGGTLASECKAKWSDSGSSLTWLTDDTLTLSPKTEWPMGFDQTLTIDVKDSSGNAVPTLSLSFDIFEGVVFVHPDGDPAGAGTPSDPLDSVDGGISLASDLSTGAVLVAQGTYNESQVNLQEGISLYGGFSASNWAKHDPERYRTTIADPSTADTSSSIDPNRAVEAGSGMSSATLVVGFTLQGGGGDYSAAVLLDEGASPTFRDVTFKGGSGSENTYGLVLLNAAGPLIEDSTIDAEGDGSNTNAFGVYVLTSSAPTIEDSTVKGGTAGNSTYGIAVQSSGSITLRRSTVRGGTAGSFSRGIYAIGTTAASTIEDNVLIHGGSAGATSYGIDNRSWTTATVITGNTIDGGSGDIAVGVYCVTASASIEDNQIDGGTGTSGSNGVWVSNGSPDVLGNTIHGGTAPGTTGVYNQGADPVIDGNTIYGGDASGTSRGISSVSSSTASVYNNLIHGGTGGSGAQGVYDSGGSATDILNNTIYGGAGASSGIRLWNATPTIQNNIIFGLGVTGEKCIEEFDVNYDPASVENNDLFGCPTLYRDRDENENITAISTMEDDLNDEGITTGGNVSTDPMFADEDGADNDLDTMADNEWQLTDQTPSDVYWGGLDNLPGYTDDYDGNPRTDESEDGHWSMGAYEYDPQ